MHVSTDCLTYGVLMGATDEIRADMALVAGATGIYGVGTPVADAIGRLADAGLSVSCRIDGPARVYFNGAQVSRAA